MRSLRLDRATDSSHYLIVGDSGSGKSTLIRQILYYARRCGDAALVLCSKPDFIPEFYRPEDGDKILGAKDDRTPYMHLGMEVGDLADAMTVMRAFYPAHPDSPNSRFFDDHACRIASYIVTTSFPRPDYLTFGSWLQDPERHIYPKLKGTDHETTLNKNAAQQKAGIDGTLNEVGTAMRMMPGPDGRDLFLIREWAHERKGWLFLPNYVNYREALRPLVSGWVDMVIRRVMEAGSGKRRVWIVLDELDTLNGLPAVIDGITQMRETGNPMVLGMQSISQLKKRYGQADAETAFSQPYTKMVLPTTAPGSKKELSDLIGEALFRRYRLSSGRGPMSASGPEEFMRPLALPSEISSLRNLNGYLVQRGEVVKFKVPYQHPKEFHPSIVERELLDVPAEPRMEPDEEPPLTGTVGLGIV